ncbi:MAG: hypothetical protein ACE5QW_01580 [Thermoplasmata archaeon]
MSARKRIQDDGAIGLSTNMLLFAVIIAISIPLVFSGFETYDRVRAEDYLVDEIARFVSISLVYFDAGGGQANITIRLRDGALHQIDFVELGGPLDSPLCASIRYRFFDEDTRYIFLDDYDLRMTAGEDSLRLSSGIWTIHIEVRNEDPGDYLHLSLG